MSEKGTFDEDIYGQFEKLSVQEALQYRTLSDNRKDQQDFEESDEKAIEFMGKNKEISTSLFNENDFKEEASSVLKKQDEKQERVVPEISNEKTEHFLENNLQNQIKTPQILEISPENNLQNQIKTPQILEISLKDNFKKTSVLQQDDQGVNESLELEDEHQEVSESLELQDKIKEVDIPESVEVESHINAGSLEKENPDNTEKTSVLQQDDQGVNESLELEDEHQEVSESLELQDKIKEVDIPESVEVESHINAGSLEKENPDNTEKTSVLQQDDQGVNESLELEDEHQEVSESLELQDKIKEVDIPESVEVESHINAGSLEKENPDNTEKTSVLQQDDQGVNESLELEDEHQEVSESLELQDKIKEVDIPESVEVESHINAGSLEKENPDNTEKTSVSAQKEQDKAVVIQDKNEHKDLLKLDFSLDSLTINGHEHFGDVQLDIPNENYPANTTMIINQPQDKIDSDDYLDNAGIYQTTFGSENFDNNSVSANEQEIETSSMVISPAKISNTVPLIVSKHFSPSKEELKKFLDRPFNKDESKNFDTLLKCVSPIASIYEDGDNLLSCDINDSDTNKEEKENNQIPEILKLETLNEIDSEEKENNQIPDQVISETILERLETANSDNNSPSSNNNNYSDETAFVSQKLLFSELMTFIGFFEEIYSLVPHEEHLNILDTPGYKAYVSLKGKSETESLRRLMNEMMNDVNLSLSDDESEEETNNLESHSCLQDYRNESMKLGHIPFILELSHETLLSQIVALSLDDVNLEEIEQSWNSFLYDFINQDGFVLKRTLNNIIISSRTLEISETDYLHLLIQEASDVFGVHPDESLFEPYFRSLDNLAIKELSEEVEALKLIQ